MSCRVGLLSVMLGTETKTIGERRRRRGMRISDTNIVFFFSQVGSAFGAHRFGQGRTGCARRSGPLTGSVRSDRVSRRKKKTDLQMRGSADRALRKALSLVREGESHGCRERAISASQRRECRPTLIGAPSQRTSKGDWFGERLVDDPLTLESCGRLAEHAKNGC